MTRILWPPGYGQQATEELGASAVSGQASGPEKRRVGDLGVNVLVDRGPEKKRIRDGKLPRFENSLHLEMKCRSSELRRPDLARLLFALFRSRHFVVVQRLKLIDHGLNELGGEPGEP